MSYLELIEQAVNRLVRPFAKADSWSEYAGRAYWRLGTIVLVVAILFLLAGGYIGGIKSKTPASLGPLLDTSKFGNFLKLLPWSLLLIVIFVAIGLLPKFRGIRDPVGGFLGNAFYHTTETLISFGEWCIRNRTASMLIIGSLAFVVGGAATGFFIAWNDKTLREQRLSIWQADVERFIVEEPFIKHNKEKLSSLADLRESDYAEILHQADGYTHNATYLHNAILLLDKPSSDQREYAEFLGSKMTKFKDEKGNELDGFEELADKCNKSLPTRHASTRESEARACDVINILLAKLNIRFTDVENMPDGQKLEYIKKSEEFYNKVDLTRYDGKNPERPYMFSVYNGKGTIYAETLTYLIKHEGMGVSLPCKTIADCAQKAFNSYEKAAQYLPPDAKNPKDVEKCSLESRKLDNNLADILSRLAVKYESILNDFDKDTIQRAHMQSKDTLEDFIEVKIKEMMECNSAANSLPDAVTIAQAYGACATLKGAGERDNAHKLDDARRRKIVQLVKATGLYLRIANSIEHDGYKKEWDVLSFCGIVRDKDKEIGEAFDRAINDDAIGGLPKLSVVDLRETIGKKCP